MKKVSVLLIFIMALCFSFTLFAEDKAEKPSVKAYGYVKLDAIYETGKASHGNFAIWATDPGESDGF